MASSAPPGDSLGRAPAIEYNFNSKVGVIVGVRLFPAGRNIAATITAAIALNIVQ